MDAIVVHYGEIGTKGENRPFFEKKLVENIKLALKDEKIISVNRIFGRIIVELDKENLARDFRMPEAFASEHKKSNLQNILQKLKCVFGIANFMPVLKANLEISDIKKKASVLIKNLKSKSIKVDTTRPYKLFKYNSVRVNEILGDILSKKFKIILKNPEKTLFVEITEDGAFLGIEKTNGFGGLPVRVSGKVVSLLSGGIDSPVSSWLAMKRGCEVIFVHFQNDTLEKNVDKIIELAKVLKKYQNNAKLYVVPFGEAQRKIIAKVASEYRMIIYRRFMARIAEKICEKEKALALLTGDNLGQVASQTLENLSCVSEAVKMQILRPLLTYDKNETVNLAKQIGTYEISIKKYADCCSFMIAKHPVTKGKLAEIKKLEKNLNAKAIVSDCMKKAKILEVSRTAG